MLLLSVAIFPYLKTVWAEDTQGKYIRTGAKQ